MCILSVLRPVHACGNYHSEQQAYKDERQSQYIVVKNMNNTTYSAKLMVADVCRKYKQLESTRLAALREGATAEYTKVRAQQDVLADLLDKWDVSIEDAGIDYNKLDL